MKCTLNEFGLNCSDCVHSGLFLIVPVLDPYKNPQSAIILALWGMDILFI